MNSVLEFGIKGHIDKGVKKLKYLSSYQYLVSDVYSETIFWKIKVSEKRCKDQHEFSTKTQAKTVQSVYLILLTLN